MYDCMTQKGQYLSKHFYGTCTEENRLHQGCPGFSPLPDSDDLGVFLDGEKQCGRCPYRTDRLGIYTKERGLSMGFEHRDYVMLSANTDAEFASVLRQVSPDVKGLFLRARFSDPTPLQRFTRLEFLHMENQRISRFWDLSVHPHLCVLSLYGSDHLRSIDGIEGATSLECLQILTTFSRMSNFKIESLKPLASLPSLREVILSGTEPTDHDIGPLISLPSLSYLWISPNVFPMEAYAKFEAMRFRLSKEYGIYSDEDPEAIFPYGKGKRILKNEMQKNTYLKRYYAAMQKYNSNP